MTMVNLSLLYLQAFSALTLSLSLELVCDVLIHKLYLFRSIVSRLEATSPLQVAKCYSKCEPVFEIQKHATATKLSVCEYAICRLEISRTFRCRESRDVFLPSVFSWLLRVMGISLKITSSLFESFVAFLN